MNEKFAVNVVVPASLEMGYVNQGSTVFDQEKIDKLADSLGANFEVSPIEYDGHALRGTYRKDGVTVVPSNMKMRLPVALKEKKSCPTLIWTMPAQLMKSLQKLKNTSIWQSKTRCGAERSAPRTQQNNI